MIKYLEAALNHRAVSNGNTCLIFLAKLLTVEAKLIVYWESTPRVITGAVHAT